MSTISLYNCKDDRKQVVKSPAAIATDISIQIKEPTSIINPVVILSRNSIVKNWASINYAYIPEFGRWYFVDNIECRHDGVLVLTMTIDVLYTYRTDIMSTQFMIARSEKINDKYYLDNERALINRRIVTYEKLGKIPQTSGKKFVLTVAGGI